MKSMKSWAGALAVAALFTGALACSESSKSTKQGSAEAAAVKDMTVAQLQELHKSGAAAIYDANGEDYRKKNGIIPGATLLTSSSKFDLSVLPQDKSKKLVFYCSGRL